MKRPGSSFSTANAARSIGSEPRPEPLGELLRHARYDQWSSARLDAHPLSWDHRDEMMRLFGNEQVGATLGGTRSAEEVEEGMRRNLEHWKEWGFGIWTAYHRTREGKPFVGQLLLRHRHLDGEDEVEIGYAVMPEFWRQGLATEAARALAWLGLEVLGLPNVAAFTWTENIGSRRVMEKIGMQEEKFFEFADLPHVLYRLHRAPADGEEQS